VDVEAHRGRWTRAPRPQRLPARPAEALAEQCVGELGLGDRGLAAQGERLGRRDGVEAGVDGGVDPGDEERRHRRDVGEIALGTFETGEVRLDDLVVALDREEQRDVDAAALGDHGLDGLETFGGAGDLDIQVRFVDGGVERPGRSDGARGVAGQARRHLDRHITVEAVAGVVDRPEHSKGRLDVGGDELPVDVGGRCTGGDEVVELVVVGVAAADGLLEDRRVRGETTHTGVDPANQLAGGDPAAPEVVEPRALPGLVEQFVQAGHDNGLSFDDSRRRHGRLRRIRWPPSLLR
jgi:hypothetical protein